MHQQGEAERQGWGPEAVRRLRGEDSRAAFARRLGITPLTVYRWELPDGAPEARRPRGRVLARLEQLARGVLPSHEVPASVPSVLVAVERVCAGEPRGALAQVLAERFAGRQTWVHAAHEPRPPGTWVEAGALAAGVSGLLGADARAELQLLVRVAALATERDSLRMLARARGA